MYICPSKRNVWQYYDIIIANEHLETHLEVQIFVYDSNKNCFNVDIKRKMSSENARSYLVRNLLLSHLLLENLKIYIIIILGVSWYGYDTSKTEVAYV
jgi:hypothetical protein